MAGHVSDTGRGSAYGCEPRRRRRRRRCCRLDDVHIVAYTAASVHTAPWHAAAFASLRGTGTRARTGIGAVSDGTAAGHAVCVHCHYIAAVAGVYVRDGVCAQRRRRRRRRWWLAARATGVDYIVAVAIAASPCHHPLRTTAAAAAAAAAAAEAA